MLALTVNLLLLPGMITSLCLSWNPSARALRSVGAFSTRQQKRGRGVFKETTTLSATSADNNCDYDVVIIGSGPASLSLAALLGASSSTPPRVAVLSKNADEQWIPNYGCWTEEWAKLDEIYATQGVPGLMTKGVDVSWPDTDCFFGENSEEKVTSEPEGSFCRPLGRGYLRVSRSGLKSLLYSSEGERKYDVIKEDVLGAAIGTNIFAPSGSVSCLPDCTEVTLKDSNRKLRAKIIVDGTGAESPFTIRDDRSKEGYQIAYGAECRVEGGGVTESRIGDYSRNKMTLFDYRSEAWRNAPGLDPQKVIKEPTFNYVMPLTKDIIFFEETSLVANPALSFQECKDRLTARLAAQDVRIVEVVDEELCYIPMGGATPRKGQRVVPIGAAAGLVHPSTGYQVARALISNVDVCDQIVKELGSTGEGSSNREDFDPDLAAARVIGRTWTPAAVRQRNFAVFGGDFLMQQNVEGLKGFFSGFFKLDTPMWAGFLAGWKGLPNNGYHDDWLPRIWFGVTFLVKLPPKVAVAMVTEIVRYTLREGPDLMQSVTPFLGNPEPYDSWAREFKTAAKGDLDAKREAGVMLGKKPVVDKES